MLEQHYTPLQIGQLWGLSARLVRETFRNEPGVMVVDRPEQMHKRGYASLRIPESVMRRVYDKMHTKKPIRS
jgi:hypothetical protein